MSFTFYDSFVPSMQCSLRVLRDIVLKGRAAPDADKLISASITPDTFNFGWQVWASCDFCFKVSAAVGGPEDLKLPADIETWEAALARIEDAQTVLAALDKDEVNSRSESVVGIGLKTCQTIQLPAKELTWRWTLPNFFFHITVAYCVRNPMTRESP